PLPPPRMTTSNTVLAVSATVHSLFLARGLHLRSQAPHPLTGAQISTSRVRRTAGRGKRCPTVVLQSGRHDKTERSQQGSSGRENVPAAGCSRRDARAGVP